MVVQRKEHHDSTGKERGLMRWDPPQESILSFDEVTLKVKNFRALRVEVLGTGVEPLPERFWPGGAGELRTRHTQCTADRSEVCLVPPETTGPATLPSCLEKHSLTASLLPSEIRSL